MFPDSVCVLCGHVFSSMWGLSIPTVGENMAILCDLQLKMLFYKQISFHLKKKRAKRFDFAYEV